MKRQNNGVDREHHLHLAESPLNEPMTPLSRVTVTGGCLSGTWTVRDGQGREYIRQKGKTPFRFTVGGALGRHEVRLLDEAQCELAALSFQVDCRTELKESDGIYQQLFADALWTMLCWSEPHYLRLGNRFYNFFSFCLRDHIHVMKGLKYFCPELKPGLDLFGDTQHTNGMLADTVKPLERVASYWDIVFLPTGFRWQDPARDVCMQRTPVENDLEYIYVEGLYYIWKATGDEAWMRGRLDQAIRALNFSRQSPCYWSRKFKLLKRGYTIDTWDFQTEEDLAISGHNMLIDPEKTRFGIMHGDNTGYAAGCRYLAEMLEHAGRNAEARQWRRTGDAIRQRLDRVAWNGRFYRHHVPEDPRVKRDLGVDESKQISLSNTYALNRGIPHAQCVEILRTYQHLRRDLPKGSPGEWYLIYPPFERGFKHANDKWEYMNGGVSTITAGELAHGAFEHGFENYGADILRRVGGLCDKFADWLPRAPNGGSAVTEWSRQRILPCVLRGAESTPPRRTFHTLDLTTAANVDFCGKGAKNVPGWTGEGRNDLAEMLVGRQRYEDIPFVLIDPRQNQRRACIGLAPKAPYLPEIKLPVNRVAQSLYLLHTYSSAAFPAGSITMQYADGSEHHVAVKDNMVRNWWTPPDFFHPHARVAWRGKNRVCPNIAVFTCGIYNPHPEKIIAGIRLATMPGAGEWFVLGLTLCDAPVYFQPNPISFGIPDHWGAAAVMYALLEGLAGVKDEGVAFDRLLLAPRWVAAGVKRAEVCVRYPASEGYASYRYRGNGRLLTLTFTSSAPTTRLEILLPEARRPRGLTLDGRQVDFEYRQVERSGYASVNVNGVGVHTLRIRA
ncbi:MAG: hypothetical protein WCS52_12385 [bacterium]|jgi:hypothetical protein